jgi:hypothetical protein
MTIVKNTKTLWFLMTVLVVTITAKIMEAQNLSPQIHPWDAVSTRWVTNGYTVQSYDTVIFVWGTNMLLTNNMSGPTVIGKMLTVIVKNPNGSCVVTSTVGLTFTVPGVGTNQTPSGLQLGAWNTPSNEWTGVYDGQNW